MEVFWTCALVLYNVSRIILAMINQTHLAPTGKNTTESSLLQILKGSTKSIYLLGQGFFVHACSFCEAPVQGVPPCLGAGFVQVRERISTPLPQVTLQGVDTDQLDQPP